MPKGKDTVKRKGEVTVEMVPIDKIKMPRTNEEWQWFIRVRMQSNLRATGHPFHHMTGDGTIVVPDPSLEHAMLQAGPGGMPPVPTFDASLAKLAVPVNRKYYGFNPFEKN